MRPTKSTSAHLCAPSSTSLISWFSRHCNSECLFSWQLGASGFGVLAADWPSTISPLLALGCSSPGDPLA